MTSGHESREAPPRLVPDEPLPPYSYVTGRFAHPTRDASGHSFGHPPQQPPAFDPAAWPESREYLWGCDLFNHGYYWEAHEAWEAVWNAFGRHGAEADFLKGLIKLAAAGVKVREGRPAGVARHAARAAMLFRDVRQRTAATRYMGLDLAELIDFAARIERGDQLAEPDPRAAVEVVFDARLWPQA